MVVSLTACLPSDTCQRRCRRTVTRADDDEDDEPEDVLLFFFTVFDVPPDLRFFFFTAFSSFLSSFAMLSRESLRTGSPHMFFSNSFSSLYAFLLLRHG